VITLNNRWQDKIIDKVYVWMDYKKVRMDHIDVEYHFVGSEDIYPITLRDENEINECLRVFTMQSKRNKYQLEKEDKRLVYLDKDNDKKPNSRIVENDLVGNSFRNIQVKKPKKIVVNFKRIAALATLSIVLIGGYKLVKKINSTKDVFTYRNPDNKIEAMSDKMVVSGYGKAREIFNKLLDGSSTVSSNDIMFLSDFLTYASMTNSDYKGNITYTRFDTSEALYKASENDRDDQENKIIGGILSQEDSLYKNCFLPNISSDRYSFDEDKSYRYFIYATSLIRGGEASHTVNSSYYNENIMVADKTDYSYFRNRMTPFERMNIYTRIKGFLSGDFEFKYKRDVFLNCYDLTRYNKDEYMQWLDTQIALENQKLINENTKNSGKSR